MAVTKSIQFLPEIFRTETNKKFLNATVDQLISEPNLKKINGYIGRKLAPSYKNNDSYIEEVDSQRQNYQLEPAIVLTNPINSEIEFVTTYPDLINKVNFYGGNANNHSRLFDNEFYSYNPCIDLDKFINFSQYYWLENGPDAVLITASDVPLTNTYYVTYDSVSESYTFSSYGSVKNPTITLARGGVYTFVVDNLGMPFYIQSKPGVAGVNPAIPGADIRNVLGVDNNGEDSGNITFIVPQADSQIEWTSLELLDTVDYATKLSYKQIQGASVDELNFTYGGLDGFTTGIDSKKIIFVNNEFADSEFWTDNNAVIIDDVVYFDNFDINQFDETTFENSTTVEFGKRNDIYRIKLVKDSFNVERIVLILDTEVNNEQKINIRAGADFTGQSFYSRLDLLHLVPQITAPLDVLFYQNAEVSNAAGGIRIVEPVNNIIDPDSVIVGLPYYTSPNGVIFTNGLKVTFDSNTAEPYNNKTYYVEGVGVSIVLIPAEDLVCSELDNDLSNQDYLTINRSSLDKNAWSRSNRWFHYDIIQASADYNKVDAVFNQDYRAKRPIIEFESNLQLYFNGREAKSPVDLLENALVTDAYRQIQGITVNDPDTCSFSIQVNADELVEGQEYSITYIGSTDWESLGATSPYYEGQTFTATGVGSGTGTAESVEELSFTNGTRVIFAIDQNDQVRNKIYNFSIVIAEYDTFFNPVYKTYIEESDDTTVDEGHCVAVNNGVNGSKQWHYTGTEWIQSQLKTAVNQAPLFDVIDSNGISFSDNSVYPATSFTGTKIFSFKESSTGSDDPVLGFPLSYKNFVSQGDIQFDNNFDSDTFGYLLTNGVKETVNINSGLLQKNISRTTHSRKNIWTINKTFSNQYQVYSYVYNGETNLFPIEFPPDISDSIPNRKVFINNVQIKYDQFFVAQVVDNWAIGIDPSLLSIGDSIFICIYTATDVAESAYYEVPRNYDINSLNTNLTTLTLGQLRNHLITLSNNNLDIVGSVPGNSNLRDILINDSCGSILQHSAPAVYAGLFLTHPTMNFINSIQLASREYSKFKIKFLELATKLDIDRTDIAGSVDEIMLEINKVKNESFPWYYSDMIPYGENERTVLPDYIVYNPDITSYEITSIFEDTKLSNKAVFVYLTRTVSGTTSKTLLVKDKDYTFNTDRPAITFTNSFKLLYNDVISIVEYNNTNGSYIPETPTKLGLYPKFVPEIYTDTTYRTEALVIQGHDGSITPAFGDFRDSLLLELERRIYNNLKVEYDQLIFNLYDYFPGKFRTTDYSRDEFTQTLSRSFLSWVGTNKVDYTTNKYFKAGDPFTWNYKNFQDGITGEALPGTWRSVYKHFYDTDRPHTHPWEMLGFSEKPDYWDDRYGPAPYTGGNYILWSDCSQGYIASGPRAGFDIRYQRPNLMFLIPVDDSGNLKPPTEIGGYDPTTNEGYSLVANFDSAKANTSYSVGDIGPVESAWRRSADYPYAVIQTMALLKPAKFFSLLTDVKNYNRNLVTAQFVTDGTGQHLVPTSIKINGYENSSGTIERASGYINWIRDYIKNLGIGNASETIKDNLSRINVQLSYKTAGYTDKKYLEILAEQSSPSSINDSVVVPEENYRIELYKGSPVDKISYSAVIVEKTSNGYTVYGYDTLNPYFYIIPSVPNNNSYTITVGSRRGVIYKSFKQSKVAIPYGFEFNSTQQVIDFLVGYQRFLQAKGFVFDELDENLDITRDWILSAKEFLTWVNQGWKVGSVIALSPVANKIKIYDSFAIVDEIVNSPYTSKVLDINSKPITKNNFTVTREDNIFTFNSNADQTIGFGTFNLVQYEHILLLDNITVFQDVIYVPELGNRQYRLKLIGAKTSGWNGSFELPGFLYNTNKIDNWASNTDYLKGTIISYKSVYYVAIQNITAADQFQTSYWKRLDSSELKTGMINNFSTNATQLLNYYDVDNQPLNESLQQFSNGLIGFRPRDYFTNLGIDVTTQSKFYQGLIKEKGTKNAINALKGAKFNNLDTTIDIYENWAVRVGEYGATEVNKFTEVILNEADFNGNPILIQFTGDNYAAQDNIVEYTSNDIFKSNGIHSDSIFKTESNEEAKILQPLPVAGFVHFDDADATLFDLNDYSLLTTVINNVGTGYKIWVARDFDNNWDIYRCNVIKGTAFALRYKIDNLAEIICNLPHGLQINDVIALKNFDPRYDGFYKVISLVDSTRVEVEVYQNLNDLINSQAVLGNGILYKLASAKVENPSVVDSIRPDSGWIDDDKVWVNDIDGNGSWGVYNKNNPWEYANKINLNNSQYIGGDHFGYVVKLSPDSKLLYGGAPDSGQGRVSTFVKNINGDYDPAGFIWGNSNNLEKFGKSIACATKENVNFLMVGAPDSSSGRGWVYVYKDQILIQILTSASPATDDYFGDAIAVSTDSNYLYIGAPGKNEVYCYGQERLPRAETSSVFFTNGVDNVYTIDQTETTATNILVSAPLRALDYIPNQEYTLSSFTSGISTFTGSYDSNTNRYTISGSLAVDPSPTSSVAYYSLTPSGGAGTGAKINVYRISGSTQYRVELVNAGSGYSNGDTLTVAGTSIGGLSPLNDLSLVINGVRSGTNINFISTPGVSEKINIIQRSTYYTLIDVLPISSEASATSRFGHSIVCNDNGSIIAIGANTETIDDKNNAGAVYVYHRTITEFTTDGISGTYTPPDALNSVYRVLLNGTLLAEPSGYYISGPSVQFNVFEIPERGQTLTIETNQFKFDQKLTGVRSGEDFEFGSALAMCGTGCNLYASSPGYYETDYSSGTVSRYVNNGRVYGIVTGTVSNPTLTPGDRFVINNRNIALVGSTVDTVAQVINGANIPGVTASVNDQQQLVIESDVVVAANKLDIRTGSGTVLADLGIEIYIEAQEFKHPERNGEKFGTKLAVSQSKGVFVVSSQGADIEIITTFDNQTTIFDSGSTGSVDLIQDSGAVYVYDLMANPNENESNHSLFAYTQKLGGPDIQSEFNFGASIDIKGTQLVVGVANDNEFVSAGGSIYNYQNPENTSGWNLIRYKQPRVDVDAISSAFIYNKKTQKLLTFFDYLDPAKGKLLGVVDQELDYKELYDPAGYNVSIIDSINTSSSYYWSNLFVGKTWWDLSTVSFIDYEQGDLTYRANNWGKLFPGSVVKVYEWVESDVLPSQYVANGGNGIPRYINDSAYSVTTVVDPATGIIKQKYYFWVSDRTVVDPVKAKRYLTTKNLEIYIQDPINQGIPYVGLLAPNSLSIYNVTSELTGSDIIIHLSTITNRSQNLIHNEYQLIQQGNSLSVIPSKIIRKLKDSLVGATNTGDVVPDPSLAPEDQIGILFRPRQSMFVNRLNALQAFIKQLNSVVVQYPILLISQDLIYLNLEEELPTSGIDAIAESYTQLSYLNPAAFYNGYKVLIPSNADYEGRWTIYSYNSVTEEFNLFKIQSYKTNLFWDTKDWYDENYTQGSDFEHIVDTFGEILSLTLYSGDHIKVNDNGNGQWLIYVVNSDLTLSLVAAQNATLEFNASLYDSTQGSGFDSVVFDITRFDPQASTEIGNIFDSIYNEILINDLAVEFNNLFFAIVNYLHTEQISPDWIFKTSFIDVYHQLRTLDQIPNYIRDDQTFYENYINEVKPYRTKLREYVPVYNNVDSLTGLWTDFDLPPFYDSNLGVYRSPDISLDSDAELFSTTLYNDWNNNYKYKVVGYQLGNVGLNYSIAPNVEITGGGGSGAKAITTINPATGKLTGIQVIDPGSGYTSTPTVYINGVGTGATAYPLLKNEFDIDSPADSYNLVRSITTLIKLDRVDYASNLVNWSNTEIYSNTVISGTAGNLYITSGNIVVYNHEAFVVSNASATTEETFDYTRFTKISSGNILLRSADRIKSYYSPVDDFEQITSLPNTDLAQLQSGVEYPGVRVFGPKYRANIFNITSNVLSFTTTNLSIRSGNVNAVNFESLGFAINQPVLIEALVPFNFVNNGTFNIVSVSRDAMMLTGKPIENTYKLRLESNVTVYAGNTITQSNTIANAYVLQDAINTNVIDVVYSVPGFSTSYLNTISINGVGTTNFINSIDTGGNVNVKLSYLDLADILDSNIYSTFLDTELGTRPEDINIEGGAYVDTYSSHAPEELVPGRMFDSLEMRVFSNTSGNTETYGFRIFHPMNDYNPMFANVPSANVSFTRISSANTTVLTSNLHLGNTSIYVSDASVLPEPNILEAVPGTIFINGEKIHYYQRYDASRLAGAVLWTANTDISVDTLITFSSNYYLVTGNVFGNSFSNVSQTNYQLVELNTLGQIRRGVDGTGAANIHLSNSKVVDSSADQNIPNSEYFANVASNIWPSGAATSTANVSYRITFSSNITSSVGDFVTQFVGNTGNARILGGNVSSYTLYLSSNITTNSGNVIMQSPNVAVGYIISDVTNSNVVSVTPNINFDVNSNVIYIGGKTQSCTVDAIVKDVITANVLVVDMIDGNLLLASNIGTRINLVSGITGVTSTTANVISISPLGSVFANGNVRTSDITAPVLQSNLWTDYGTGVGLEGSTTAAATFIRSKASYIP